MAWRRGGPRREFRVAEGVSAHLHELGDRMVPLEQQAEEDMMAHGGMKDMHTVMIEDIPTKVLEALRKPVSGQPAGERGGPHRFLCAVLEVGNAEVLGDLELPDSVACHGGMKLVDDPKHEPGDMMDLVVNNDKETSDGLGPAGAAMDEAHELEQALRRGGPRREFREARNSEAWRRGGPRREFVWRRAGLPTCICSATSRSP